jgi:hypothetical protein
LLNGQRIERTVLCNEDVLAIGPFRLKVQVPEALMESSPSSEAALLSDTVVLMAQNGSAPPEAVSISDTAVLFPQIQESPLWNVK